MEMANDQRGSHDGEQNGRHGEQWVGERLNIFFCFSFPEDPAVACHADEVQVQQGISIELVSKQ